MTWVALGVVFVWLAFIVGVVVTIPIPPARPRRHERAPERFRRSPEREGALRQAWQEIEAIERSEGLQFGRTFADKDIARKLPPTSGHVHGQGKAKPYPPRPAAKRPDPGHHVKQ